MLVVSSDVFFEDHLFEDVLSFVDVEGEYVSSGYEVFWRDVDCYWSCIADDKSVANGFVVELYEQSALLLHGEAVDDEEECYSSEVGEVSRVEDEGACFSVVFDVVSEDDLDVLECVACCSEDVPSGVAGAEGYGVGELKE